MQPRATLTRSLSSNLIEFAVPVPRLQRPKRALPGFVLSTAESWTELNEVCIHLLRPPARLPACPPPARLLFDVYIFACPNSATSPRPLTVRRGTFLSPPFPASPPKP